MRFATQGTMKPVMPTLKMLPMNRAMAKFMLSLLASSGVPTNTPHRKTMGYSSSSTIMSIFQTEALEGAPDSSRNHCSKPVRAIRAWNSSVSGAASSTSFFRTGESSQACRLASLSKRRMATKSSCTPGTGGSKR